MRVEEPGGPDSRWRLRPALALAGCLLAASAALAHAPLLPAEPRQAAQPGDAPNGEYPGYWSWPGIVQQFAEWKSQHPRIFHQSVIGQTAEGRDILAVRVQQDAAVEDPSKPEILFMGGVHPCDQAPQAMVMKFLEEVLAGYGQDERITTLVDTRGLWFIPVLNVDGKVHDFQTGDGTRGGGWSKNRRPNPDGSFGVDLARNFQLGWGQGEREPRSDAYQGPGPLSEPETAALDAFFETYRIRTFVNLERGENRLLTPPHLYEFDQEHYARGTRLIRARQRQPYGGDEVPPAGSVPAADESAGGGMPHTWGLYAHGSVSYTFEIDLPSYPSPEEILRHYEENVREPLFALIEDTYYIATIKMANVLIVDAETSGPLVPGARVEWTPELEGSIAYAALASEHPAIRVTGDVRNYPLEQGGYLLHVAEDAVPGTEVRLTLYMWNPDRRRMVMTVPVWIEAPPEDGTTK